MPVHVSRQVIFLNYRRISNRPNRCYKHVANPCRSSRIRKVLFHTDEAVFFNYDLIVFYGFGRQIPHSILLNPSGRSVNTIGYKSEGINLLRIGNQ